ncbi:hypothetical protein PUN28_001191 [Cardiocondyla obscurior]|uniref:Uncharacterized protein n=1 Tax=Cardiocondyla obscurior TaxID=286306 RepID=A0AAW2H3R5_9HYME
MNKHIRRPLLALESVEGTGREGYRMDTVIRGTCEVGYVVRCASASTRLHSYPRATIRAEIFIDFGSGNYAPQNEAVPLVCPSPPWKFIYATSGIIWANVSECQENDFDKLFAQILCSLVVAFLHLCLSHFSPFWFFVQYNKISDNRMHFSCYIYDERFNCKIANFHCEQNRMSEKFKIISYTVKLSAFLEDSTFLA